MKTPKWGYVLALLGFSWWLGILLGWLLPDVSSTLLWIGGAAACLSLLIQVAIHHHNNDDLV